MVPPRRTSVAILRTSAPSPRQDWLPYRARNLDSRQKSVEKHLHKRRDRVVGLAKKRDIAGGG